jgi:hypothetical protein
MESAMSGAPKSGPQKPAKVSREDARALRLKTALKANMARRKAQARARTGEEAAGKNGPDNDKE